jgi:hypothetical protein
MKRIVTAAAVTLIAVLVGAGWAQTGRTLGGPAPDEERMQQMMKTMGDMQEQMKGMHEQMKGMTGPMPGRMGQMMGQMAQMQRTMQQHREQMVKQCPMGAPQETLK